MVVCWPESRVVRLAAFTDDQESPSVVWFSSWGLRREGWCYSKQLGSRRLVEGSVWQEQLSKYFSSHPKWGSIHHILLSSCTEMVFIGSSPKE